MEQQKENLEVGSDKKWSHYFGGPVVDPGACTSNAARRE